MRASCAIVGRIGSLITQNVSTSGPLRQLATSVARRHAANIILDFLVLNNRIEDSPLLLAFSFRATAKRCLAHHVGNEPHNAAKQRERAYDGDPVHAFAFGTKYTSAAVATVTIAA